MAGFFDSIGGFLGDVTDVLGKVAPALEAINNTKGGNKGGNKAGPMPLRDDTPDGEAGFSNTTLLLILAAVALVAFLVLR